MKARNEPPLDRSWPTPKIPFMASLWIRSGYDMKVEMSSVTYQVGAHFETLDEGVLLVPLYSRYTQVGFNLISVQVCIEGTRCSLTAGDFFKSLVEAMYVLTSNTCY